MEIFKLKYQIATYNKVKQVTPCFEYGTYLDSKMNGVYIENLNPNVKDGWRVFRHHSGSTGLRTGHIPSRDDLLFGGTLRECKEYVAKMVEEFQNLEAEQDKMLITQNDVDSKIVGEGE